MNIGFVSYFAFRPHVEHLYALSKLATQKGHNAYFLSCDSALSTCYRRELTRKSRISSCITCTLGGVRAYPVSPVESARSFIKNEINSSVNATDWGRSSACTILRTESQEDKNSAAFINLKNRLSASARESFSIAIQWIRKNKLDAIVCFNGRMDATRGVMEAARFEKIRFVSMERTWGNGLLLLPEADCLGLQEIHRIVTEFREYPLTKFQAVRAAKIVISRFLKKKTTEWRAYNLNSIDEEWPVANTQKKILILPSSFNEYDGHPDWQMKWTDQFDAFTNIVRDLELPPNCYVMRGHPNWSQNVGATGGERIEQHYQKWAAEKGILYIPGNSRTSTKNLIAQSDLVILNGGSAAIEAGLLGKQIISLVETTYKHAGFVINYLSKEDKPNLDRLKEHDPTQSIRLTLRFLYSWGFRVMQYTREIIAMDAIHYRYLSSLDGTKLMKIIETGHVHPDDSSFDQNTDGEDEIISLAQKEEWAQIDAFQENRDDAISEIQFSRKSAFRIIDSVRDLFPPGDQ
jgi:hypothetical protein